MCVHFNLSTPGLHSRVALFCVQAVWFFQAFKSMGTLTSMVWYSILDIRAFLVFGAVVMAGFAEAMHVLHGNKFRGDDEGNYLSFQRAFETLSYSMLGEFAADVCCLPDWIQLELVLAGLSF